jgi:predicted GNAT family acetyltransferase
MTDFEIRHQPDRSRFAADVDGVEAALEYRMEGSCMVITHTHVPEPVGGRGIAGALTRAAFEHARVQDLHVRPACSYAAGWVDRHPEYGDLLG